MQIKQYPRSPSNAVTTSQGLETLRNLFTLAVFGRYKMMWPGMRRKRWHGPKQTVSTSIDDEGNRVYTHVRHSLYREQSS